MSDEATSWKKVFQLAQVELNPAKQLQLCAQARRMIHDRSLELAGSGASGTGEQEEMEVALRALWVLEQNVRDPEVQ